MPWYFPAVHGAHSAWPNAATVPARHRMGVALPSGQAEPSGQIWQRMGGEGGGEGGWGGLGGGGDGGGVDGGVDGGVAGGGGVAAGG
eukprot:7389481-Prymnesium_polylepis.1